MDMLEAQLDAYERLLTELAPSLPAGLPRQLSRTGISALIRRNRAARGR